MGQPTLKNPAWVTVKNRRNSHRPLGKKRIAGNRANLPLIRRAVNRVNWV